MHLRIVADLPSVLERAANARVVRIIVTAGSASESAAAIPMVGRHPLLVATTVGVHPTKIRTTFNYRPMSYQSSLIVDSAI
jgi:Tat protein secretion system quality control protein TatD with DNase activity